MSTFIVKVLTGSSVHIYEIDAVSSFDAWDDAFESHRNALSINVTLRDQK